MHTSFILAVATSSSLRVAWQSIVESSRRLSHELAGIWRYAKARDEFNRLPDAALRDLGIDRSEFGSHFAESEGRAAATRRRIFDSVDRGADR
jgi:uncharacterized protein YjiS (DUF1127 family)